MIRQFTLINSKNQNWTFTDTDFKCFLSSPQGLGFSRTISTYRYGNAQELQDITDAFPNPTGEIIFYDDSNSTRYEKYNNFCRFIADEPLTLEYILPNEDSYFLKCVVSSLGKTEGTREKTLSCPIQFFGLGFYEGYAEPYSATGSGSTMYIDVVNDSDMPIGLSINVKGSMLNPYITFAQNNEIYGEAKFIDNVNSFSEITINSKDGMQDLILKQNDSILPNPLSYQDLSISNGAIYVTFVKLARGTSRITVGVDSGSVTNMNVSLTPLYRSV